MHNPIYTCIMYVKMIPKQPTTFQFQIIPSTHKNKLWDETKSSKNKMCMLMGDTNKIKKNKTLKALTQFKGNEKFQ